MPLTNLSPVRNDIQDAARLKHLKYMYVICLYNAGKRYAVFTQTGSRFRLHEVTPETDQHYRGQRRLLNKRTKLCATILKRYFVIAF